MKSRVLINKCCSCQDSGRILAHSLSKAEQSPSLPFNGQAKKNRASSFGTRNRSPLVQQVQTYPSLLWRFRSSAIPSLLLKLSQSNRDFSCKTYSGSNLLVSVIILRFVCEVGTVGKISDCLPEAPGFNPRPGRGLNFGRPFATPSVDRDVKPLVYSLDVLSGDLNGHALVDKSRLVPVLWTATSSTTKGHCNWGNL